MSSSARRSALSTASRWTFMIMSTSALTSAFGAPRAPAQQRAAPHLVDHAPRLGRVERRHPERHVLEDLDEHAAEAEHHDRAEQLVLAHADHALDAAIHHLGDEHRAVAVRARAPRTRRARLSADSSPSRTRPRSLLWAMSAELAFITTG